MWEHNNGIDESSILQNQFTAYLCTAIRRKKIQYMRRKTRLQHFEILLEPQDYDKGYMAEPDMTASLPTIEQLESTKLQQALEKCSRRDLYILFAKALEGRSLAEISIELGLRYNTVAAVYYRMIQRIKKELGGDDK